MIRCEYCKKEFKRESSAVAHMCANKKRWLQKDEKYVKLGLKFFNDWYRIAMGSNVPKDYKNFMKSKYYGAFVRFGMYVLDARVVNPEKYLEWLVKEKISIDKWCKDSIYNKFLIVYNKRETAERALERFVLHALVWSERTGNNWSQYWKLAAPHVIVNDIKMGKISPWIFLGYDEAKERLDELPSEMLEDIASTIDLAYWKRKLDVNKPTIVWINSMLGN